MTQKTGSHEISSARPAGLASGIPVYCWYSEIWPAARLVPHPENPKLHPARQLDRYERVIQGNGWRRAIVVSDLSGCIIKGHGAWQTAARRGWDVPVEIQHYASAAEEHRDLLADNRLAELAETDDEKLAALLAGLDAEDLPLTGFDAGELQRLVAESDVSPGEFPITSRLNERYDYVLIFCENESDFVFLQNLCGVRTEASYKKSGIGIGRAVPFQRFIQAIRENHHSINVQGGNHDDAPADSQRVDLHPTEPA